MDWRTWAFNRLRNRAQLTAILTSGEADIYGAGSLTGAPADKPFIVLGFGIETPELRDDVKSVSTSQYMTVFVHDEPGDYLRIGQILEEVKLALEGVVPDPGAFCAIWQGNSGDLGDDQLGTIMRNAEFRLVERKV